jgi:hypothetical protein
MADPTRAFRALALPRSGSFGEWVRVHDERWSFVILYLGLAVGLSVFVSLFWLLVVAGLHFLLECGRQAHYRSDTSEVLGHALWEVKLDVGLVLLALTLVLYIDVVMGLLGLQSAARAAAVSRAGARIGTRAAAWERNIRTFLLTVDEMARLLYAAVMVRKGERRRQRGAGPAPPPASTPAPPPRKPVRPEPGDGWRGRWGVADRIGVLLVAAGVLLLLVAPLLTPHDWATALAVILAELRPFPA